MNWYLAVLKKYADFSGRARRQEYWMFFLVNIAISIVLGIIGGLIKFPLIGTIYSLAVMVPGIAVGVRRLHDTGRSGWMLLVGLIPIVGAIMLIIWFATEGQAQANQYGPNPKAEGGQSGVALT